jgi:MoaD family protein
MRFKMQIDLRYFTVLSRITKKRQERITIKENSTIKDVLAILIVKYGENFRRYVSSGRHRSGLRLIYLLNGQDTAQFNGLKTKLRDGDTLVLMPPIAGG